MILAKYEICGGDGCDFGDSCEFCDNVTWYCNGTDGFGDSRDIVTYMLVVVVTLVIIMTESFAF